MLQYLFHFILHVRMALMSRHKQAALKVTLLCNGGVVRKCVTSSHYAQFTSTFSLS